MNDHGRLFSPIWFVVTIDIVVTQQVVKEICFRNVDIMCLFIDQRVFGLLGKEVGSISCLVSNRNFLNEQISKRFLRPGRDSIERLNRVDIPLNLLVFDSISVDHAGLQVPIDTKDSNGSRRVDTIVLQVFFVVLFLGLCKGIFPDYFSLGMLVLDLLVLSLVSRETGKGDRVAKDLFFEGEDLHLVFYFISL